MQRGGVTRNGPVLLLHETRGQLIKIRHLKWSSITRSKKRKPPKGEKTQVGVTLALVCIATSHPRPHTRTPPGNIHQQRPQRALRALWTCNWFRNPINLPGNRSTVDPQNERTMTRQTDGRTGGWRRTCHQAAAPDQMRRPNLLCMISFSSVPGTVFN